MKLTQSKSTSDTQNFNQNLFQNEGNVRGFYYKEAHKWRLLHTNSSSSPTLSALDLGMA